MTTIQQLRKLAEHRERVARMDLAVAERDRIAQQAAVDASDRALAECAALEGHGVADELNRQTWLLRTELVRRGGERKLLERQRDVGRREEVMRTAAREKGALDRIVELRAEEVTHAAGRREQQGLDESGIQAWLRAR